MGSPEEEAYTVARYLDANYILVIFGGYSHYSGDDISKFLWMIRIAAGVFPQIKEQNYYNQGTYRIDAEASPIMKNCLMYKLCYYKFDQVHTKQGGPTGWDTVRNAEIGHKGFKLTRFREAYTSERWIVRIYEVLPLPDMDPKMNSVHSISSSTTYPSFTKLAKPTL